LETTKTITVHCCGECPYSDAQIDNTSWYCIEPTKLDGYGFGAKLGDNSKETLNNIPEWCPLEDAK